MKEECGKHGKVKKVVVYQEAESEADDAEVIVKIFVQFDKSSGGRTRRLILNFIVPLFHFIVSFCKIFD